MFSGIIEEKTKAKEIKKNNDSLRITFKIPINWKFEVGESVNIDGVCTTIETLFKDTFTVFYMPETLSKTTFNKIAQNHEFNLEKSLTLSSLVGGHLVSGHIDTIGKVSNIIIEDESKVLMIDISSKFTKYIIYKGSISVNGVSLTVVNVSKKSFTVSLIPHTLKVTNLGNLKKGDIVNIEVDMVAKYIEKLTKRE